MHGKLEHMLKEKKEDIVRRMVNDPNFGYSLSLVSDLPSREGRTRIDVDSITGDKVKFYLMGVAGAKLNLPMDESRFNVALILTEMVFGDCEDIAEMVRNYLKDAKESGSSMQIGHIRIVSEFDKFL